MPIRLSTLPTKTEAFGPDDLIRSAWPPLCEPTARSSVEQLHSQHAGPDLGGTDVWYGLNSEKAFIAMVHGFWLGSSRW